MGAGHYTAADLAKIAASSPEAAKQIAEATGAMLDGLRLGDAVDDAQIYLDDKPVDMKRRIKQACSSGLIAGAQPVGRNDWDMPREGYDAWLDIQVQWEADKAAQCEEPVEYAEIPEGPPPVTMAQVAQALGLAVLFIVLFWSCSVIMM